jgi:Tfp pilus assembly protein PilO
MTTADLVEKLRRYPIPSVSAIVVLVCLLVLYFRIDVVPDLKARLGEVQDQRVQVDLNVVAGATLGDHLAEMRERFAALDARVVQPSELATNMNYFYQLESDTGVSLIDLRQNVTAEKPAPKTQLVGIGYSISLAGSYAQVIGYLNELETGTRLYRLRNFNIQRGRELNQSAVTLGLNLELLGWK